MKHPIYPALQLKYFLSHFYHSSSPKEILDTLKHHFEDIKFKVINFLDKNNGVTSDEVNLYSFIYQICFDDTAINIIEKYHAKIPKVLKDCIDLDVFKCDLTDILIDKFDSEYDGESFWLSPLGELFMIQPTTHSDFHFFMKFCDHNWLKYSKFDNQFSMIRGNEIFMRFCTIQPHLTNLQISILRKLQPKLQSLDSY